MAKYEDGYKLHDSDMNLLDNSIRGYGVIIGSGCELLCSYSGTGVTINFLDGIVKTSISDYTVSSGNIDLSALQDVSQWKKVFVYVTKIIFFSIPII